MLNDIEAEIDKSDHMRYKNLMIITERRNVSNAIGHNSKNIRCIKRKYNFTNVDVIAADVKKVKVICS